jgi:hypothetical protein
MHEVQMLALHGADSGFSIAYGDQHDFALVTGLLNSLQYYDPTLRMSGSKMLLGTAEPSLTWERREATGRASVAYRPPGIDKLLVETDLIQVYSLPNQGSRCVPQVALVFKVDKAYEIAPDERYQALIRDVVLPKLQAVCPSEEFGFENYVSGYSILQPGGVFPFDEVPAEYVRLTPRPLNTVSAWMDNGEVVFREEVALKSIRAYEIAQRMAQ